MKKLFNPDSVAVVGANNNKKSVGYCVFKNIKDSDYKGKVYPVNIKKEKIQGVDSYASVKDIPRKVDLVVIATPAKTVCDIVEECGKTGVQGVVIISSGFKEAGEDGKKLYIKIHEIAERYKMRIIGPNCLGFINPSIDLNATFSTRTVKDGKVAFISQSGALCTAMIDWANEKNIGFRYFVSIGSMVDVGFCDLIDYFDKDPKVKSIIIYMESISNPTEFIKSTHLFSRKKPVIILKAGKSSEGAEATLSHTGSLAGNDDVFDAVFERVGAVRVNTIQELFNYAKVLDSQKIPEGNRLAIITNAGGPGVIATDFLIEKKGKLSKLSEESIKGLDEKLPLAWSRSNPVDVLGDAGPEKYKEALKVCIKEEEVDGILVILTPQSMTKAEEVAEEVVSLSKKTKKPIFVSWMGGESVEKGIKILEEGGVPTYDFPEQAVSCFLGIHDYQENIKFLSDSLDDDLYKTSFNKEKARKIIKEALQSKRYSLSLEESKEVLSCYDIPVLKSFLIKEKKDLKEALEKTGYPAVGKINSSFVSHKTEMGGVELNIKSLEQGEEFFERMRSFSDDNDILFEGVVIEKMISDGYELLIGAKKDNLFGSVIIFGAGGVTVEVLKDTNLGVPPLSMKLATRLIQGTDIYKVLQGVRGRKEANLDLLKIVLCKFSYLLLDLPEIKEVDINPFSINEKEGLALDALIVLE
jgi:acetyltransferase